MAVLQAYRSWSSIWSGEYFGIRVLCGIPGDAQPHLQRLPGGAVACGRSVIWPDACQSDQLGTDAVSYTHLMPLCSQDEDSCGNFFIQLDFV